MEILIPLLLGLFGMMIQLGIVVGIVVVVLRLARRHREGEQDVAGAVRRFFVYVFLFVALLLLVEGTRQLVVAVFGRRPFVGAGAQLAGAISLLVVGGAVWIPLWRHVRRRLADDSAERGGLGWMLYLNGALAMSLAVVVGSGVFVVRQVIGLDDIDVEAWAALLAYGGAWAVHRRMWRDEATRPVLLPGLSDLVGSLLGLIPAAIGLGMVVTCLLQGLYDVAFGTTLLGGPWELLLSGLAVGGVGGLVWWYHWFFRDARRAAGDPVWLVYVIVFPVLGSVATLLSVASAISFGALVWLFGSHEALSAAEHFSSLPAQLGIGVAAFAVWEHHRRVLRAGRPPERAEPDRVYDYVLAAAGLVAVTVGVAILLLALFDALAPTFAAPAAGNTFLGAITAIVVGGPVWWWHWSRAERHAEAEAELRSVTRRVYLLAIFGVAAMVVFVAAVIVLQGILVFVFTGEGSFVALEVPLASLLTGVVVGAYHLQAWRTDRTRLERFGAPSRPKDVVLVAPAGSGLDERVRVATGAAVRLLAAADGSAPDVDRVVAAIDEIDAHRILVVAVGEHVDVIPLA